MWWMRRTALTSSRTGTGAGIEPRRMPQAGSGTFIEPFDSKIGGSFAHNTLTKMKKAAQRAALKRRENPYFGIDPSTPLT
jgi:hypothetical protein